MCNKIIKSIAFAIWKPKQCHISLIQKSTLGPGKIIGEGKFFLRIGFLMLNKGKKRNILKEEVFDVFSWLDFPAWLLGQSIY